MYQLTVASCRLHLDHAIACISTIGIGTSSTPFTPMQFWKGIMPICGAAPTTACFILLQVGALKDRLESETGVFTRHMKLIFKGKVGHARAGWFGYPKQSASQGGHVCSQVLEDKSSLAQCKIGDGAKLMLLVSTTGQVCVREQLLLRSKEVTVS